MLGSFIFIVFEFPPNNEQLIASLSGMEISNLLTVFSEDKLFNRQLILFPEPFMFFGFTTVRSIVNTFEFEVYLTKSFF